MLKLVTPMRGATTPLNEAVTQRRSTQGFKPDPIADEVLHELLGHSRRFSRARTLGLGISFET